MTDHIPDASNMVPTPRRIQLRRTKGWRLPENTATVSRPSRLGNPFPVKTLGRVQAVALHQRWLSTADAADLGYDPLETSWLNAERAAVLALLPTLRGKNLACWCPIDQPCHADVLLELANAPLRCEAV